MGRCMHQKSAGATSIDGLPYRTPYVKKHTPFPRTFGEVHPLEVTCVEHALSFAGDYRLLTMGNIVESDLARCVFALHFDLILGFTESYVMVSGDKDSSAYVMSVSAYTCEIDANMAGVSTRAIRLETIFLTNQHMYNCFSQEELMFAQWLFEPMSHGLFDEARGEFHFLYISYRADMSLGELLIVIIFFHTLFKVPCRGIFKRNHGFPIVTNCVPPPSY